MIGVIHKKLPKKNGKIFHLHNQQQQKQQRQRQRRRQKNLLILILHHGHKINQVKWKMIGILMHFLMMFLAVQQNRNWKRHDVNYGSRCSHLLFVFLHTNNSIKSIGVGGSFFSLSLLQKKKFIFYGLMIRYDLII
jgi:hypothetical protein